MSALGIAGPCSASLLATPAPGTATPIPNPSNNPVQYIVSPNTTVSSSAYNSNNFKIYNDLNNLIGSLNACAFIPGYGISSVVANNGLTASLSGCNPGTGQTLTLGYSGSGGPSSASTFMASNIEALTWPGSVANAGDTMTLGSGTSSQLTCGGDSMNITNLATSTQMIDIDSGGDFCAKGDIYTGSNNTVHAKYGTYSNSVTAPTVQATTGVFSGTVQAQNATVTNTMQAAYTNVTNTAQEYNTSVSNLLQTNNFNVTGNPSIIRSATPFVIPFIGEATSGTGHLEHGVVNVTIAGSSGSYNVSGCQSFSYNVNFSVAPYTFYTLRSSVLGAPPVSAYEIYDGGSSATVGQACVHVVGGSPGTIPLSWFAIGE